MANIPAMALAYGGCHKVAKASMGRPSQQGRLLWQALPITQTTPWVLFGDLATAVVLAPLGIARAAKASMGKPIRRRSRLSLGLR